MVFRIGEIGVCWVDRVVGMIEILRGKRSKSIGIGGFKSWLL